MAYCWHQVCESLLLDKFWALLTSYLLSHLFWLLKVVIDIIVVVQINLQVLCDLEIDMLNDDDVYIDDDDDDLHFDGIVLYIFLFIFF